MFSNLVSGLIQTFSKIQIPCPQHPQFFIETFCLRESCSAPFCCSFCGGRHPADHINSIIPLKKLFHDESITKESAKLNTLYSPTQIKSSYLETLQVIDKIEDEILSAIDKLRKKVSTFFINFTEGLDKRRKLHMDFNKLKEMLSSADKPISLQSR